MGKGRGREVEALVLYVRGFRTPARAPDNIRIIRQPLGPESVETVRSLLDVRKDRSHDHLPA